MPGPFDIFRKVFDPMRPLGGGGAIGLASLLNAFAGYGDDVALMRRNAALSRYTVSLLWHIGYMRYADINLDEACADEAGDEATRIVYKTLRRLWKAYDATTTPAVTEFGAGWTVFLNAAYTGGRAALNGTTGRYIEITTPLACDRVGIILQGIGLGTLGCHIVTIDGDPTLATGLPTAQQLVDAGRLAAAALVGGGGTLNPTDRILNSYNGYGTDIAIFQSGSWAGSLVTLASDLASGAHTVRITVTGYRDVSATANNLFYSQIICGGDNAALRLSSGGGYAILQKLQDIWLPSPNGYPIDEISYSVKPTGAAASEWMGHIGSMKLHASNVYTVDGVPVTLLSDNQIEAGAIATVAVDMGFRHSEIDAGETDIANYDLVYALDSVKGLTILHTVVWMLGGVAGSCFPGMMGANHTYYDRFTTFGFGSAADMTDNNGTSKYAKQTLAGYAWDYDGYAGMVMSFPLSTALNWSYPLSDLHWVDVITAAWKKLYLLARSGAYSINDVWSSEINYRYMWFPDGANQSLIRFV